MIDRQGFILLIDKMNNTAFKIIVEYRTKYSNKIIFSKCIISLVNHIPGGRRKQERAIYDWDQGKKQRHL